MNLIKKYYFVSHLEPTTQHQAAHPGPCIKFVLFLNRDDVKHTYGKLIICVLEVTKNLLREDSKNQ